MKRKKGAWRYSDNVYTFLIHNRDLLPMFDGERITIMEELDGRLSIALRITPGLTKEKITEQLWELLQLWNKRLLEWQGYDHDNWYLLRERIQKEKSDGKTYPQIARMLNEDLSEAFLDYCDYFDPTEDMREQYQSASEYVAWLLDNRIFENLHDRESYRTVDELGLQIMMYQFVVKDNSKFDGMLTSAYRNILSGDFPFRKQAPYTPKLVQNALERFEYEMGNDKSRMNCEDPLLKPSFKDRDFIDHFPFCQVYKRQ